MQIKELFLGELEREAVATRKALAKLPEQLTDFKPHPKSMPFDYLASLVATMPAWIAMMIHEDYLDLATEEKGPTFATRAEALEAFEQGVNHAREALAKTTDEHLMLPWSFRMDGKVLAENPRHIAIRDAVFQHLAHHRGQMTVYLRLVGEKVPAIYGPSADEWVS